MLIENADYFIKLIPFPNYAADGATMPNSDGTYTIYINANIDDIRKLAALDHELNHIEEGHFYSAKPIDEIELEAG